jgi:peroxiredoxin
MSEVPSTMLQIGTEAPDFELPEPATGRTVSRDDFAGVQGLLVVFLSNHCPYVKHVAAGIAAVGTEYQARGLAVVGINANDIDNYPADSPEKMIEEVENRGYTFPYLFDESQEVAKAYQAACTPDFFLFDGQQRLAYRGQFDTSRPSLDTPVTGADLRAACDAVLAGEAPAEVQIPSVGCNIKWKAGNAPAWFGPQRLTGVDSNRAPGRDPRSQHADGPQRDDGHADADGAPCPQSVYKAGQSPAQEGSARDADGEPRADQCDRVAHHHRHQLSIRSPQCQ